MRCPGALYSGGTGDETDQGFYRDLKPRVEYSVKGGVIAIGGVPLASVKGEVLADMKRMGLFR